jgi:ADP-ribose pyrophosphatase
MRKKDDSERYIQFINDPRLISPQCYSLTPVTTVHENPWFVVQNRGGYFTTEYIYPQVIVLPIVDHNSIVMIRAKRPVIADITLELPAGSAKENETPLQAATRELAEETGIDIKDLNRFEMLPPISDSPNRNPKLLYVYQINLLEEEYENRRLNDTEVAGVECMRFEDIKERILQAKIYVTIPLAIISRFLLGITK